MAKRSVLRSRKGDLLSLPTGQACDKASLYLYCSVHLTEQARYRPERFLQNYLKARCIEDGP